MGRVGAALQDRCDRFGIQMSAHGIGGGEEAVHGNLAKAWTGNLELMKLSRSCKEFASSIRTKRHGLVAVWCIALPFAMPHPRKPSSWNLQSLQGCSQQEQIPRSRRTKGGRPCTSPAGTVTHRCKPALAFTIVHGQVDDLVPTYSRSLQLPIVMTTMIILSFISWIAKKGHDHALVKV